VRNSAVAMSSQTNYSNNLQGRLLAAKAAPEANPQRRNLRCPSTFELSPTGLDI
jgi:hypothetical protein